MDSPSHYDSTIRIASLLPSVTDICVELGLSDNLVAITHECDLSDILKNRSPENPDKVRVVTKSGLNATLSQKEIDDAVKAQSSGDTNVASLSLYPILEEEFKASNPTIVLTQTLCLVCAPSPRHVKSMISTCNLDSSIEVFAFEPATLVDVVESFVKVAEACRVPERGEIMKRDFMTKLNRLKEICPKIESHAESKERTQKKPKVLLLEWIDPPYDGGHWIPDMIEWVNCDAIKVGNTTYKSKQVAWDDVYNADPDVILVACCGFDLQRNIKDALNSASKLAPLRAAKENRIFACNGDVNFARPGPKVLAGIAVVMKCAYQNDEKVMKALDKVDFLKADGFSMEWEQVNILDHHEKNKSGCDIGDIEDVPADYTAIHEEACRANQLRYVDPDTGFLVMTEIAHKNRGKCCGGGCRHCPYNHENVKDKARKIQQPAFLFEGNQVSDDEMEKYPLMPLSEAMIRKEVKILVLFFSGGKDSFLAIRSTIQKYSKTNCENICLILLTTFDATSRVVAHQEIEIETIVRQAKHLNIPLLGVPMHRASSETYLSRIGSALDLVAKSVGFNDKSMITSMIFGDLHLVHIRNWRDQELGKLNIHLEYPLWQTPYSELFEDLQKAAIEIDVSAATEDFVQCGEPYNRDLFDRAKQKGYDAFGENGEFHTRVQVWSVSRERALGLC
jgi:ABC-type Fe3+-hydroxamate transport system substrate-binding protein/diphthamide synthase (EF-2-diphthine--ammonia ligase)